MRKLYESHETGPPISRSAGTSRAGEAIGALGAGGPPGTSGPALRFDWTDWLPYLEGEDVSEEKKRELIETLWSVVVSFVDLGWRIDANPETGNTLDLHAILTAKTTE